eukprot:TRINITY_DN6872_c0_g1_i1.p1 TRINITY_DN6872_c0_g1~~TRINITY_DN6872_c0_g1_i1.p1  ORF type:complete len:299 (+),score=89.03 TRINITY_DN6872_c0_g1_i1:181-1077(+)
MSWFSSLVSSTPASDADSTASSANEGVSMAKIGSFFSGIASTIKHVIEEEENKLIAEKEKTERAAQAEAQVQDALESHRVVVPPWEDLPRDAEAEVIENVRKQILSLPKNKRNFMENPPSDVTFDFNYEEYLPVCIASLKADPQLERMRFYLVPQYIREQRFWRNYFYRVKIIKEAHGLVPAPPRVESVKSQPEPSRLAQQIEVAGSSSDSQLPASTSSTENESQERREQSKADEDAIALESIHNEFISDELDSNAMKAWEEELKAELESFSDEGFQFDHSTDLDIELSEKINKELGI